MILYMAVTSDEYERPLAVEPTVPRLAQRLGLSSSAIYSSMFANQNGKNRGFRFVAVKIDDDDLTDDQ